ncbi:MAG: right-handed parallel beta-helix repeat-containing protein [Sedimentisphaerales bacterium]
MRLRIPAIILSVFFIMSLSNLLFSQVCFAQTCAVLKDIAAGEVHTLALAEDGSLWATGYNGDGQLGLGNSTSVSSLQRVHGPNDAGFLNHIIAFDGGWYHSLAVDSNHYCWAWGGDGSGQLGNGPNEDSCSVPILVHGLNNDANGLRNIVKVSAGRTGSHSLALRNDGNVAAWGNNGSGQCGDNTTTNRQYPVLVWDSNDQTTNRYLGQEANIVDVEAGTSHSLALASMADGGIVYEWGAGVGSTPRKVPGQSGGLLSNIVDIAAFSYSLAVDSSKNVWYWSPGGTPAKVPGGQMGTTYLQNIVKVAAGGGNKCAAIDVNGQVWEWSINSGSPVRVTDGAMQTQSGELENIIALDVGYADFKVAVDKYGRGWSWGSNAGSYGGTGGVSSTEPVEMLCPQLSSSIYLIKNYEIEGEQSDCVEPFQDGLDNYLVFEIYYGNPITNPSDPNYVGTIYDVNIIDHLPLEINCYSADSNGIYDGNNRTVTWHIGTLSPGMSGSVTLTVKVNEYARPCGQIINNCEIKGSGYDAYTDVNVPVCPWGGEIIYCDKDAQGFNNGTSWDDAFTDLQEALQQARNTCTETTAIWVAAGTYKPVQSIYESDYQNKSFELVDGIGLIGHFAGDENSPDDRVFSDANSETVLEGRIGANYYDAVYKVVKAQGIDNGLVDGFTIKDSYSYGGIYLDSSDVSIVNCKFKNNNSSGVYAYNYSYPDIHNCLFMDNSSYAVYASTSEPDISYSIFDGNNTTSYGLDLSSGSVSNITDSDFHKHTSYAMYGSNATINVNNSSLSSNYTAIEGSSATIDIEGSELSQNSNNGVEGSDLNLTIRQTVFERNSYNGIKLYSYSDLDIQNSVIRKSGYQGIYLNQNSGTQIINNWIHNNGTAHSSSYGAGIYFEDQIGIPKVWNNTIYDNFTYGIECSQNGADPNILNCIISGNDTNDLYRAGDSFNKVNYCLLQHPHSGTGNLTGDPGFKNPSDPNDLHIGENSQCKNAGEPNVDYDYDTDIDGEARIRYGRIDIGADEYYWSPADYNLDGIVNFNDYVSFAQKWRMMDANISLDDDNDVDFIDLSLFCADWLWQKTVDEGWMLCMSREGNSFGKIDMEFTGKSDSLMLSTAAESLAKMPQRLADKSRKFYCLTPATTISAKQRELALLKTDNQANIKELLKWLDEVWLSGDLKDSMTENEYQEFRKTVEQSK